MSEASVGDRLDHYVLEKELGRGGFARVFLARDTKCDRGVALKVLRRDNDVSRVDAIKRFEREIRTILQLEHPNVVRIFDAELDPERGPYYIMEHLRGKTLADWLGRGSLSLVDVYTICQQLCSALYAVHSLDVVYRDLKPHNIFLVDMKTYKLVKLIDFGLALSPDNARVTSAGVVVGTPLYMAPEQIMNSSQVSHLSDIYAFGILLFRMLTGEFPYEGRTHTEILRQHCFGVPTVEHALVPVEIRELLRWVLCKEPGGRPKDMLMLWNALQKAILEVLHVEEVGGIGKEPVGVGFMQRREEESVPLHTWEFREEELQETGFVKSEELLFTSPGWRGSQEEE